MPREYPIQPPDLADWMVPAEGVILAILASGLRLTPKSLAINGDYERHYVSRRCRTLKAAGLIFKDETNSYVLTTLGERFYDGDLKPEEIAEGPPRQYRGFRQSGAPDIVSADQFELLDRINFHGQQIVDYTWGYIGAGPKHLALCLVGDVFDGKTAETHAQAFMEEIVTDLDDEWELPADEIREFVEEQME